MDGYSGIFYSFWNSFLKSPLGNYFIILRTFTILGGYIAKRVVSQNSCSILTWGSDAREIFDSEKVYLKVAGGCRPTAVLFIKNI